MVQQANKVDITKDVPNLMDGMKATVRQRGHGLMRKM